MILNNLYCTHELIIIFLKAEYIALKYNNYFIMPIHLLLGLLLTNNLCTQFLHINKKLITDKLISLLLSKYTYYNNKNVINAIFSNKVINILTKLNNINFKVNSLNLLILLLNEKNNEINYLFKYLNLKNLNFNYYIPNTTFPINIQFKLKEISKNILNLNFIYNYNNINIYKLQYIKLLQILNLNIKKHIFIEGEEENIFSFLNILINNINNKIVPLYLYNTEIWVLNDLFNYDIYTIISKILDISNYFINNKYKLILIIKNIELFNDDDNKLYYLYLLLNKISNSNIHIIIPINKEKYNLYFKSYNLYKNYFFNNIKLKDLSILQLFLILKNNIQNYINYYKINIPNNVLYELINLSKKYILNLNSPIIPLILLENSCSKKYLYNSNTKILNYKFTNTIIKQKSSLTINDIKNSISEYLNISKINLFKNNKINKYNLIKLEQYLYNNIHGQNHIFNNIIPAIKQNLIGLKTKNKPIGSWILCGPSGTGKTELAKILAKQLFGSENELIRFDMSEYMEKHSVSRLIGSPPGYIGYSEGGQLTEQVYNKPNCVILFDEIEKAHPDIYNIMLQILDEGRLTDTTGKLIDFTNTIILLTSNLGCPTNYDKYLNNKNYLNEFDLKDIKNNIKTKITNYFKPELLNRLTNILIFNPLNIKSLNLIFNKFITELKTKLYLNKLNIIISINNNLKYFIIKLTYNPLYGARPLKRLLELIFDKSISDLLLNYNKKYFNINKYILYYFLNQHYNLKFNIYSL
ncbi:chaperone protein ClpM, putative [Plasmodium chabaudi chabaudi]|uniref:Caseinolytic protease C (ClpC) n=5 Tax=Plasmodium chabaudi TaxID=5825 RepID=R4ZCV7_PLACU|nr:caseinolytic protease C (ClpC) [Plasmodium chabaudi chabaudi]BAL70728.1 caseinolytic protease C [Plasmodium chabaudi]CCP24636.1 caseinolytic protease C (ClpC) [Plasmodium chabaudi chabaudi]CCP24667.1 caseinolytic protease C (ClpC) [Plasmodium chabaudi chabaudi]CDR17305.1 chaperone protein ClpM, putative [Plasmodium chabaudi chabaudi]SCL89500.1 chaperone protein ClpM, putative [Plasmodium chabaudi chabaudi]|eukprot:YP_009272524.1 caseinolytic protease C (ClpC) (apicoplast) [Plasmodium chabaudi chabaudi]